MAKNTVTPETAAPAEAAAPAEDDAFELDFGAVSFSIPIPVDAGRSRASAANAHPFAEKFFTPMFARAMAGEQPFFFVPTRYWLSKGNDPAKVAKGSYEKDKLRAQFNAWRDKDKENRSKVMLVLHSYSGEEGVPGISQKGVGMWLKRASDTPAE